MGTELTTTGSQTSGQVIRWSKPSLPEKLSALVNGNDSLVTMPVVGPESAKALQAFFDHPEPPLADRDWIESQIAILRVKPSRSMSAMDGKMLVETFVNVLLAYPRADLGYAVGRLMLESKWFPDVSEIVKLAEFAASQRAAKKHQAWKLLHKHKTEWTPPIAEEDLCKPEDAAAILAELRIAGEKV